MREMITSYLETSPGLLARIDAAVEADDLTRLSAEAHGWKGVSQTMGFSDFASLCQQLEEAGRRGDHSLSRTLSASIHPIWERMRHSLMHDLKERE
jgi:HPt (histidine-containing phosphotransfer) domain-containing protein